MNLAARFVRALGYFTVLPVGKADAGPPEPEDVVLLPLVGACVGLMSGTFAYLASRVLPQRIAASLACAGPIVFTGALHLDGFLDTCDAAFAAVDLEKRREILRDPRHGSFAFAGGALLVLSTYATLREIEPRRWPLALALCGGIARTAGLVAASTADAGGDGTAASAFAKRPDSRVLAIQTMAFLAAAIASDGLGRAVACATVIPAMLPLASLIANRFEGRLGGDAYGFLICSAELGTLVALATEFR